MYVSSYPELTGDCLFTKGVRGLVVRFYITALVCTLNIFIPLAFGPRLNPRLT